MISCKKIKRLFPKAINNELSGREMKLLNKHLENCSACKDELAGLQHTLETMKTYKSPEPEKQFIDDLWINILPELKKEPPGQSSTRITIIKSIIEFIIPRSPAYQIAGAVSILIIGILIGRYVFSNNGFINTIPSNKAAISGTNVIQAKAENYIDRSKVLLMGLMNFDPAIDDAETINLQMQKSISRELLTYAADLKSGMNQSSQNNLKELITDLEFILLQIANLESEQDIAGIELVKQGVDRRGIFLKINIHEMLGSKISSPGTRKKPGSVKKEI